LGEFDLNKVMLRIDFWKIFMHTTGMKTLPLLLISAVMMLFTQVGYGQGKEVSAQDALTEAQRDYIRGDMDAAKERFQFVLQLDPQNVTARNFLHMIETAEAASGKNGALEKELKALVIPHVELKEATFDTALEYLKQGAAKASGGKTKVNFVVQLPQDVLTSTKVTLNLSDVPFTEVLHYVSELTGFTFSIDKYAITVKQASASTPAPASNTDTPTPTPAPLNQSSLNLPPAK
jgi:Spy/CpxP family protein refolding chaperone